MSFVITTYVPEGIVMASDSRQCARAQGRGPNGEQLPEVDMVTSDNCDKLFFLENQGVGLSVFGETVLGNKPIGYALRLFEEEANNPGDGVMEVVDNLMSFMSQRYPKANTSFHVAGYALENGVSIPHVYHCQVSHNIIQRLNTDQAGEIIYGTAWGGQGDIMARLINAKASTQGKNGPVEIPTHPIIWEAMPIIDAVDFSEMAVDITAQMERFQMRPKTTGGPIDLLLLTPHGADWVYRKQYADSER